MEQGAIGGENQGAIAFVLAAICKKGRSHDGVCICYPHGVLILWNIFTFNAVTIWQPAPISFLAWLTNWESKDKGV